MADGGKNVATKQTTGEEFLTESACNSVPSSRQQNELSSGEENQNISSGGVFSEKFLSSSVSHDNIKKEKPIRDIKKNMQNTANAIRNRCKNFKREKSKVCIIGCSDSKTLAPVQDPDYEFWGVNNLFLSMPEVPWSRWFEIHDITNDGVNYLRRGKYVFRGLNVSTYIKRLSQLPCLVYMQKEWPQIPNAILYPLHPIVQRFGTYFTNTISYEIALAIALGFKQIDIYGVDMAVGSEYAHQRPSCEYFIAIARTLGINVIVPPESDLLKTRFLYGFEEQKDTEFRKKVNHTITSMQQKNQQAAIQRDHLNRQCEQYTGAILGLHEMLKIWDNC